MNQQDLKHLHTDHRANTIIESNDIGEDGMREISTKTKSYKYLPTNDQESCLSSMTYLQSDQQQDVDHEQTREEIVMKRDLSKELS